MNVFNIPLINKPQVVVFIFSLFTLFFSVSAQEKVESRNRFQQVWSLFANSSLSDKDLMGDWEYKGTACTFETENLLKKAGGAVVASQVERTFNEYCDKIGISEGKSGFVFKEDSSYTAKLGMLKLSGKYRLDAEKKVLSMSYMRGLGRMTAHVHRSGSGLKLLFDADSFLQMMKTLSMFTKNNSVEILAAMADLYDGMLLGFDLDMKQLP
ncbi:MAG: DUF4923 family protein [Petrimonas sp.]|jgi:hypothetical protein|nr:DUF4923 family protein [Petrimonas sp.]MEA5064090.1 DUF4923 family protein [Petrimonas sp.]HMM18957.1 DUF4923 family protein [Petrimonas sp.]